MMNSFRTRGSDLGLVPTWQGLSATVAIWAGVAYMVFELVEVSSLRYGGTVFLFPVIVAASQWGLTCALVAVVLGVFSAAFFFYPPVYSFHISDPREYINLTIFSLVAIVTSHLASQLRNQAALARQREIDMRDLYEFSRRLAVAFDVSDIHKAIEDHLASVLQRRLVLYANARDASANATGRHAGFTVPRGVRHEVAAIAGGERKTPGSMVLHEEGDTWLVRAVSPKAPELGVIAINLDNASFNDASELRARVDAVLADATATLERLGVAHAINEARMRSRTDQLREALIGSVSHELRTPLASIMGAATVLGAAPALERDKKLRALIYDVRDEAERLNNDIQNLLDASRISSDGVNPNTEWADPADIIHSAIERCRRRLGDHRVILDVPRDLPVIKVDPVLVQQALIQIFDNAAKYSPPNRPITVAAHNNDGRLAIRVSDEGSGLTAQEKLKMWDRFSRGDRHIATISGSGLGLWIASAFVVANGGTIEASSKGVGQGTSITIELPVEQAVITHMESEVDE
ncbi:MAG: DUF4118 domain-containing protein [Pseudolabrys sp.]|nr:DUF4118 domain-containing protein [Pseudolabrys sp.]